MPSSLIIVGLALAWLAVLVPMVARKRQEITQTNDAALAARVVRSGSAQDVSTGPAKRGDAEPPVHDDMYDMDERDVWEDYEEPEAMHDDDAYGDEYDIESDIADEMDVDDDYAQPESTATGKRRGRRYRPGRGGFDPEAAALAARAKYAFRQRVVVILLLTVVTTAVVAGFVLPVLWWVHGAADITLAAYLVYLRRQASIEEEIRQRRLARLRAAERRAPRRPDPLADIEVLKAERGDVVGAERKPMPTSRVRRQAVMVDLEDEDPAFHELDDPGRYSYRRAVGE